MLKDKNITNEIKATESKKSRRTVFLLSIIYIPSLLYIFNYCYKVFIKPEKLTNFKFISLSGVIALAMSLILYLVIRYINSKYFLRDKEELKRAFIFSFLVYATIQLLFLEFSDISIRSVAAPIGIFIIANGLIIFFFIFDYDTTKLGIYTKDLEDFIFYSTDRKFIFKNDLRHTNLKHSKDPLADLQKKVEGQTKKLRFSKDSKNIGKYFTYYVQRYDYNDYVYVLIYFSSTGKRNDEILSIDVKYEKAIYEQKLQELNDVINEYLG